MGIATIALPRSRDEPATLGFCMTWEGVSFHLVKTAGSSIRSCVLPFPLVDTGHAVAFRCSMVDLVAALGGLQENRGNREWY